MRVFIIHQGIEGRAFVAKLSLQRPRAGTNGNVPDAHDAANLEYDWAAVDAHGDGWAVRSVPGKLYRFHA